MKSGFVNIVGNPNVGKSTLSNKLVGARLSIITSKAQTTRKRIMGIVNGPDYQIVFSDTPGVLKPNYRLQEAMLDYSKGALRDADVLLYVTDVIEQPDKNADFLRAVEGLSVPVLVIINKIDLTNQADLERKVEWWHEQLPKAEIMPVSALCAFNTDKIIAHLVELLPEAPAYFDRDALTDQSERFFVTEIIREKILLYYSKEVPYSCEVVIDSYTDRPDEAEIHASILVARDSQKGIIIGHQGVAIKKLRSVSRRDIEAFLGKRVDLRLFVKVAEGWRDHDEELKQFGYILDK